MPLPTDELQLLHARLASFSGLRVLCVGDVMLDRFVEGTVARISPEAPVAVLSNTVTTLVPGGAANVARNVAAIGGKCTLVGTVGTDDAAVELLALLAQAPGIIAIPIESPDRPTPLKTRFVSQGQHLLRVDNERAEPVRAAIETAIIAAINAQIAEADVLILSDYAKGTLTAGVLRAAIGAARRRGLPIIADPKGLDFSRYAGATVITPNAGETAAATGIAPVSDDDAEAAGRRALDLVSADAILVTRGAQGMTLVPRDGEARHIVGPARQAFDVVGAGDTVVAALALALAAGVPLAEAASLANTAAGIVVGKRGTAVVHPDELIDEFERRRRHRGPAILTRALVAQAAAAWRAEGLVVGFTNGVFDVVHPGHISLLRFARAHCDRLIVGINSDASVRRLKGPDRPINAEADRATVVQAFGVVDAVVIFSEDTPLELIEAIQPKLLVKGGDYTIDTVVGADFVLSQGGEVLLANLVPDKSSSRIIARARGRKA